MRAMPSGPLCRSLSTEVRLQASQAPWNNAFKLTRSHGSAAWRHFVPPCDGRGGPSQLNAMLCGPMGSPVGRR
jgi:hypothetical protein